MAGLVTGIAMVSVGPPLSMMEPSWVTIGTAPVPTMLLPPTAMPLPVLSPIRLKSTAVMVPEPGSLKMSGPKPAVLPATMVLFSVRKPALRIPPPMPRGTLLPAIVEFRTIRVPLLKIPPPDMADSLSAMVEFVIVSVPPPLSFTMPPPLPEDTLLAIVELAISSVPRLKIAPAAPLPSAIVNPEIATMTPAPTSKGRKLLAPEIVSIAALGPVMVRLSVMVGRAEVSVIVPLTVNVTSSATPVVPLAMVIASRRVSPFAGLSLKVSTVMVAAWIGRPGTPATDRASRTRTASRSWVQRTSGVQCATTGFASGVNGMLASRTGRGSTPVGQASWLGRVVQESVFRN